MDEQLLGLRIKQLRSEYSLKIGKKFNQTNLAEHLGISRSYLGDIESGRTYPNNEVLNKLADIFEVSSDYILGKTSERFPGEIDKLDEELKALYPKIKRMSSADREKILKIIKDAEL